MIRTEMSIAIAALAAAVLTLTSGCGSSGPLAPADLCRLAAERQICLVHQPPRPPLSVHTKETTNAERIGSAFGPIGMALGASQSMSSAEQLGARVASAYGLTDPVATVKERFISVAAPHGITTLRAVSEPVPSRSESDLKSRFGESTVFVFKTLTWMVMLGKDERRYQTVYRAEANLVRLREGAVVWGADLAPCQQAYRRIIAPAESGTAACPWARGCSPGAGAGRSLSEGASAGPLAGWPQRRAEVPADTARPHHDVHDTYDTLRGSMASLERRVAVDAARAAGQLLKRGLPGSRRIAYKGSPTNLVTEMDARVEELIVGRLAAAFPDDAVLAEERGASAGRSGRRWIIDPLDGTTNYAHGFPAFGVSIALESAKRVELGVIYDPNLDEMFVAERGRGSTLNDRLLAVSTTATLDESLLATEFPYNIREVLDNNLREYAAFSVRARAVRRMGSAVLYLAWLASGRLDGYWELRLGPWDVAAGSLLVEEAGGRISDLTGGALDLDAPSLVATNGRIHAAILAVLGEVRGRRS
jgi:myo-inositol-1(or 4)-monophosphatase